jgi:tripartite-type tricarboxylate transporter receptor subunit TctC
MKRSRRQILQLAAVAAALPAVLRSAHAQAYPTRPVRLIVGAPAGGGFDIAGRLIVEWLSGRLGQPFVVENRPGAGGNIGTEAAVRAPADGYTLLLIGPPSTINATLYDNLDFNIIRDIAPIAGVARVPQLMEVHPSFPPRTVPEVVAYAKTYPGKIRMASGGTGSGVHLAGELFKMLAGVDMRHVPYRDTTQALAALIAGDVDVMFDPLPSSIELVRSRELRALAVTTAARSEALPDLPTVGDFVPGYEAGGWVGLGAPRDTPVEIVDSLNQQINAALADPKMKARLAGLGGAVLPGSPAEFGKLIAGEIDKWAKVVKFSGVKPG